LAIDDKLNFRVLEFNKDGKKIIISHSVLHDDTAEEKRSTGSTGGGNRKGGGQTRKAVQAINDSSEKSTLGDLDALSALKEQMEKDEKGK
jgi:small subunit ribosomal protein S1